MTHPRPPLSAAVLGLPLALVAVACTTGGAAEPPPPAEPTPETITLVVVDDEPLSLSDALDTFLSSHAGHGVLVRGEPAVRELAGRLVEEALFLAEAYSLGVDRDERVQAAVEAYQESTAEIEFWKREVDDRVEVSDEEVEAFFAKTDVALNLSMLQTDTRAETEALRERVLAGEDLSELAARHSTHGSRNFGGKLTYVRRGELDPGLEAAAFGLAAPGETSAVLETEEGFAFLRLDERMVNAERPPREVMLPRIRSVLEGRHEDELREEVSERIRAEADARVDAELLTRDVLLAEDGPERVVAEAAGHTLTLGELRDGLNLDAVRASTDAEVAAAATGIAGDWVLARAVRSAARRSGLLDAPEVAGPTESFRRDAILKRLYGEYVYADVTVDAEDVRAYYEEQRETEFTRPAEVRLAYIVTESPKEAEDVVRRLQAGEDFADLARERSIDATSAAHGGRIGWIRPGQVLPEVEETAFTLEPDQVSEPIETDLGTFVLKAFERKAAVPLPFEACRDVARQRVLRERQREAYAAWALRLRERAEVELDERGIEQAVAWLDAEAERRQAAGETADPGAGPVMMGPQMGSAPPGHGAFGPTSPPASRPTSQPTGGGTLHDPEQGEGGGGGGQP